MQEILLSLHAKYWDLIKSGKKTIEIRKTKPRIVQMPFRVIVYVTGGIGVVGKFDCDTITETMHPVSLLDGSCLTEKELTDYAAGKPLVGWHIKKDSVIEFETPFPLKMAVGLSTPPQSWCYLNKEARELKST